MIAQLTVRVAVRIVKKLLPGVATVLVFAIVAAVVHLENTADLKPWHEPALDEDYSVRRPLVDFGGYLALEDRLFRQLDTDLVNAIAPDDRSPINRFTPASLSDPAIWPRNWNRSYILEAAAPRAVVVLIHGMSDSPYSLHNLAETLHAAGASVIGLRLPGHGTIPAGLLDTTWQDMAAAVALAATEARRMAGAATPVYLLGYSIGGALAVHHALEALRGRAESVDGLVLISPAIGLTPLARLAGLQARLGHLFGLRALAWNSIGLEYDPFKYGSFTINAARQSYLLTEEIKADIALEATSGALAGLPPILAFQSVIDATVSSRAVIESLFRKLPQGPHELVLFDVNRRAAGVSLLRSDPGPGIRELLATGGLNFTLSLVTNAEPAKSDVKVLSRGPNEAAPRETSIGLEWPDGVYSLSHVALPFPASDPLYGDGSATDAPGIRLGNLALRGERDGIVIPASDILRLRWNPFYPYLERRVLDAMGLLDGGPR